ncbi:MAG: hypothetical protein K0S27_670 [Gammaproteobacteria bacterium]|jgi:hypothetical protein|nr:hypothetical protein [Gammaproteobacteria bacterium]
MKKVILFTNLLILAFFCIDSFALKVTPGLTLSWSWDRSSFFNDHSDFHAIMGYPHGKPAILVYSPNIYNPYAPNQSESFAKLYLTEPEGLNSSNTITNEQFFDLRPKNITREELINTLKERQEGAKKIIFTLQKISWVASCKSFYALGSLSFFSDINYQQPMSLKPVILTSPDGKQWSVDKEASNIISSKEIMNLVSGNSKDYPILIALGDDGKIYYKDLRPNGNWHLSNTSSAPRIAHYNNEDVFLDGSNSILYAYQDKFLLFNGYTKIEENTYKMKETFLVGEVNKKGLEWKSLSPPSESLLTNEFILVEGLGKMMVRFAKVESIDTEGYSTLSEKSNDQGYAELSIDEATNTLVLNNKISDAMTSFTPDLFTSAEHPDNQKLKSAMFLSPSASSTEGTYYLIFSDPKDYFSSFYWTKINSLQELAQPKLMHLELEDGHPIRLFGNFENPEFQNDFLSINNQTYLLGETLPDNPATPAVIATFYRIKDDNN